MPWTIKDVDSFKSGLTAKQKRQWVAVANSALQKCLDNGGTDKTCAPKAIKMANGTVKETALQRLSRRFIEIGARNNKSDSQRIQTIHDHSVDMGAKCAAPAKEALDFSQNDLMTILRNELREDIDPNAYILDVFDTNLVYAIGYEWSSGGSASYQIDYELTTDGDINWGQPVEVVRKVTYVPTSTATESVSIDITGDTIALVEKAVTADGEVMLKLISPGEGSSGIYSTEVLKRDGPRVFRKGLHNFIDHPTPTEEAQRPEGSVNKLGSVLTEDAKWYDDYNGYGAGLYAKAKVVPQFAETLNTIAPDIGVSIRANGKAHVENVNGKRVNVIDAITEGRSVDYVTLPGRGGKVLALAESARNNAPMENNTMTDEEKLELTRLREAIVHLNEQQRRNEADRVIDGELGKYPQLPKTTIARLRETLTSVSPSVVAETGALDVVKLAESVKTAVSGELAYLATLGLGQVGNMGGNNVQAALTEAQIDDLEKQANEAIKRLGA